MTKKSSTFCGSTGAAWARFRFSVIGALLSAPPPRGQLQVALEALADKTWIHPVSGEPVQFSAKTIQRWYYLACRERDNPIDALRRAVRKDAGKISLPAALAEQLRKQYREHRHWTYRLHYDNLAAWQEEHPSEGRLVSYSTVRRYMQSVGMVRQKRKRGKSTTGQQVAELRREEREIRSYEAEYVGSLWHLDFHHGSLKVLSESGQWERPLALCILDDHSRLCCHVQWYLSETAEDLVHGLSQAFQKRGLPRALMTDNGSAMLAEEFQQGLERLSVLHQPTLPYSPYQNGKQETFWGTLEGRLMEMLTNCKELSLDFLNEATQAWVEMEYNRRRHSEIGAAPITRFLHSSDVLRDSPSSAALREAFRLQTIRMQRRSDGTISVGGVRFELPSRFRHFRQVTVRLARWDLSRVDLIDPESGKILSPIYPLDRQTNADGRRARVEPLPSDSPADSSAQEDASGDEELPPLLKKILKEYSATGLPPAYLPKRPSKPVSDGLASDDSISNDSISNDSISNDSISNDSNEEGEI